VSEYATIAEACATWNCREAYLAYGAAVGTADEAQRWDDYQDCCEAYKRITGREFAPVKWK
jgi:hypothetical protein